VTPERWQEVNKVLAGALERTPEERSAFLDEACTDPDLRREVESLLTLQLSGSKDPPTVTANPLQKGSKLGPYAILGLLGAGGMGIVYRARDERLQRDVAIKVLPPGALVEDAARRRFRKESLALAKLNHPNIAAVYDVGEQDGTDFLVMEYVPGQSLAEKAKTGALPAREALSLGGEIARALQEAHEQGIVHRDLKPGNIIVTPKGHAKVLDFGLAKLLAPEESGDATLSMLDTVGPVGTPRYMSPEQAEGRAVDSRTDLWSLGVVLYELLAGKPPFASASSMGLLRAIVEETPKPLREVGPDVPQEAERIVSHALEKDASKRYQTASEMVDDLSSLVTQISSPALPPARRELRVSFGYAVLAALVVVLSLAAGGWFYHRSERRHWAREQAIPEIAKLQDQHRALAAFQLMKEAERYLPGDPHLAQIADQSTKEISITSSPPGATVEIKDYLTPDRPWFLLGTTPLTNIRIPVGYFRWRVSKQGVGDYVAAPLTQNVMNFALDAEMSAPNGMSWVKGGIWGSFIGFVGGVGPYDLHSFFVDRYEVTNRQYQEFVDKGGYQKPEYWKGKFVRNGRELKREEAMTLFRDSTGRAGPSTWEGGHFPEGQADYPVSGVSWYEASAYAAFAGKSLPVFAQWYAVASPDVGHYIVQVSNISLSKLAPVGKFQGLGLYGTYDMAGNIREWVENNSGDSRKFILGGDWKSQTYMYSEPEALSPFDRSPENGFRCVRNIAPLSPADVRPVKALERDFSKFKPASDEVFHAYQALYSYDKTPLHAKGEGVVQDTADWREEKITFDTAYDNERMAAYLFIPKNVRPPYQTVIFSPSARVLDLHDSRMLGDIKFFDYVVQSGRAVLYPVLKGTYERQGKNVYVGAAQRLSYLTDRSKDLERSLDYLETRPDIDKNKVAYLGVSMGSAEGVIYATVAQQRLKTAIFLDGGYFLDPPPRGGDQADFAPRLRIPVLMVNGSEDYAFSLDKSQNPLFQMLGSPAADKRHVVLHSPHDVTERRPELVQAVLAWLDKYLGRVE
jgi:serine/threonine protein kinase/dienelactone hydrolase